MCGEYGNRRRAGVNFLINIKDLKIQKLRRAVVENLEVKIQ